MNSLTENLLIRLISQVGNKSALFRPQQITGSANIQILHGNMNTASQIAKVLNRLKAPLSLCGKTA